MSLPHCCCTLPLNCFQLPSTWSQFMSRSPMVAWGKCGPGALPMEQRACQSISRVETTLGESSPRRLLQKSPGRVDVFALDQESAGTVSASENPVGPSSTMNVPAIATIPCRSAFASSVSFGVSVTRQLRIVGQGFDAEQDPTFAGVIVNVTSPVRFRSVMASSAHSAERRIRKAFCEVLHACRPIDGRLDRQAVGVSNRRPPESPLRGRRRVPLRESRRVRRQRNARSRPAPSPRSASASACHDSIRRAWKPRQAAPAARRRATGCPRPRPSRPATRLRRSRPCFPTRRPVRRE